MEKDYVKVYIKRDGFYRAPNGELYAFIETSEPPLEKSSEYLLYKLKLPTGLRPQDMGEVEPDLTP